MNLVTINTTDCVIPEVSEHVEFSSSIIVADCVKVGLRPFIYRLTVRTNLLKDGLDIDFTDTLLPIVDKHIGEDTSRVALTPGHLEKTYTFYVQDKSEVTVTNTRSKFKVRLQRISDLLKTKLQGTFFKPRRQISAQDRVVADVKPQQHLAIRVKSKKGN